MASPGRGPLTQLPPVTIPFVSQNVRVQNLRTDLPTPDQERENQTRSESARERSVGRTHLRWSLYLAIMLAAGGVVVEHDGRVVGNW